MSKEVPFIRLIDSEVTYVIETPWWIPKSLVKFVLHNVKVTDIKPKKIEVRSQPNEQ